ncbi:glycosyltransferase [Catenuloplanes atrovinosus]|uniref:UDP:flavonoid glycosyltransferase YjiC (YdhE family) n=1 Tax=Catenuloplanes atrovinosus TaxID=137266 RepID=A0AAE3YLG6_9ACTN|nr:nucleotide disphospho-sugar-binding domain-containing protein [Catenuloplanes atrovinosus]MDR7274471.1 UDP:flavonoid glycosyltransferase YjiC (YdhE family) [Catenuloplanes atrovinosus]
MARFLFSATALAGHVNPALPLVAALTAAGHRVRFMTGAEFGDAIIRAGAEFHRAPPEAEVGDSNLDRRFPERAALRGLRKLRWDLAHLFVAPAVPVAAELGRLLADEPADLLVADVLCLGAGLAAEAGGPPLALYGMSVLPFPSVDVAPTGLALPPRSGPLGRLRNRALHALVRRTVFGFTTGLMDAQRARLGLPPAGRTALEIAPPAAYLQLSPPGFEYPRGDLPGFVHFVGHPRPRPPDPGWARPAWWSEVECARRPVVVVTQGTVATDLGQLVRPALAALAGEDVLVVALTSGADPAELGALPANARTAAWVPFGALFPHASVVVTNGGFGGVQTALGFGVPLVVAGRTEDKAEVAARVAYSGVGVDLRTQTPAPAAIRDAVRRVLAGPSFAARARALRDETGGQDPAERASALLTALANGRM